MTLFSHYRKFSLAVEERPTGVDIHYNERFHSPQEKLSLSTAGLIMHLLYQPLNACSAGTSRRTCETKPQKIRVDRVRKVLLN